MQPIDQYYQSLPYAAADDAAARAIRPVPDEDAARAELMRICSVCTSLEIAAVLEQLATLDGRYRESRFVGIVARLRGDWTGLPTRGPLFEWEWYWLWPGGAPERRERFGEWLKEALELAGKAK